MARVPLVGPLLAGGADVNIMGLGRMHDTALILAVRDNASRSASRRAKATNKTLLKHGADVSLVPKPIRDDGCLLHNWLHLPRDARFDEDHLCVVIWSCLRAGADLNERNNAG